MLAYYQTLRAPWPTAPGAAAFWGGRSHPTLHSELVEAWASAHPTALRALRGPATATKGAPSVVASPMHPSPGADLAGTPRLAADASGAAMRDEAARADQAALRGDTVGPAALVCQPPWHPCTLRPSLNVRTCGRVQAAASAHRVAQSRHRAEMEAANAAAAQAVLAPQRRPLPLDRSLSRSVRFDLAASGGGGGGVGSASAAAGSSLQTSSASMYASASLYFSGIGGSAGDASQSFGASCEAGWSTKLDLHGLFVAEVRGRRASPRVGPRASLPLSKLTALPVHVAGRPRSPCATFWPFTWQKRRLKPKPGRRSSRRLWEPRFLTTRPPRRPLRSLRQSRWSRGRASTAPCLGSPG